MCLVGSSCPHTNANNHQHQHPQTNTTINDTARFKSLDGRLPAEERRAREAALLRDMDAAAAAMARGLGSGHLLVQGARRYQRQLSVATEGR